MKKVLVLVSFMIFSTAYIFAQQPAAENPNAPEIAFDNVVHDYGTIFQGADGNCVFKFKNTGKEPLVLTNVSASCGCTIPTWPREPILPGQTSEIKVHYDTNRLGVINKQITVTSNAKTSPVVLTIKGLINAKPEEVVPAKPVNENSSPVAK